MSDEHHSEPGSLSWHELERELQSRPPRYDSEIAWAKLGRAIDDVTPPADVRPLVPPRPVRREIRGPLRFSAPNWTARIAAALVVGSAIALAWRAMHPASDITAPSAMREVATARGRPATVRLADGTRVELGVGSRLRYAPELGHGSRDVYLDGEAYFDVVHDERRPFAVHTARAVVRDLGTKFGVRGYADVPEVEVVVAEGAVALAPAGRSTSADSVLLRRGDLGRVEADGHLATWHGVDVAAYLAWVGGRLVFVDAPLREVVPRLARWYGIDVRIADSAIAGRRYTASIRDESLPQLLDLMAMSLELRIERAGNTVMLYDKPGVRLRSAIRSRSAH